MLNIISIEEVGVRWTDEMVERVGELLRKGRTYSETAKAISEEFDCRVSRNSVISKAKRAGISDLNKNLPYISRGKIRAAEGTSFVAPKKRSPPLRPPPTRTAPRRKPLDLMLVELGEPERAHEKILVDTKSGDCMWPVSDEGETPTTFCCRPKMRHDVAYCSHHMARAARRLENGGTNK